MSYSNYDHYSCRPHQLPLNRWQAEPAQTQVEWGLPSDSTNQYLRGDLTSYFPPVAQALIEELSAAMQASPIMTATLVLGAIAAAVQSLYDIIRPNCSPSPTSLFCLAIRASGGKKTSVMNILLQPHVEFQRKAHREQAEDSEYQAKLYVWKSQVSACRSLLRKHWDDSETIHLLTQQLTKIIRNQPKIEKQGTNILMKDTTKQALSYSTFENSPSVALVSDEATTFFKNFSHDLTTFNQGYDGADVKMDRKTTCTYFVEQPRMSLILATQPRPFRRVIDEKGLDLIEIGTLPRMFVAMCNQNDNIQINSRIVSQQARDNYRVRINKLLALYGEKLKSGDLSRTVLTFSPEAEEQWERTKQWLDWASLHNGSLSNVSEYAARCAEHIARVAANLHVIENQTGLQITLETILRATLIVRWYAQQFQNLFGDLCMPQHERDAKAILNFLWAQYQSTRIVQYNIRWLNQHTWGGKQLRCSSVRVIAAIEYLESQQVVFRATFGKRCDVFLDQRFINTQLSAPSGLFQ